ncbi:NAD(P)H-dependent flavin oxidoreductase [Pseudoalteromonas fenneropenaei]|uniref:Propionate 3-nitronate monooxygenase n=1 Tax=Pseudoalteromonas fenneropenaei TaxID=1737459 RepID=A0ABV7CFC4_9GAMM
MSAASYLQLINTRYPIIQAPMAGVQDSRLALAVTRAGGLGSVPCGMLDAAQVRAEIAKLRAADAAIYNLNFFCHTLPELDWNVQARWLQRLQPYFAELELEFDPQQLGALRLPFDHQMADAIAEFAPPVMSFHFGLPDAQLLQRVKQWGAVVMASATTKAEGMWLQQHGADIVIAQGAEAGGHRGMFLNLDVTEQPSTSHLLAELCSVLDVPVVAAGGIADMEQIHTMMQSGASAVQIGTAYLLCDEAITTPLHRDALMSGPHQQTELTNLFSGRPARGIANRLMRDLGNLHQDAPPFPYAAIAINQLRKAAEAKGRADFTPLWSGQNRTGCKAISAYELTFEFAQAFSIS